MKIDQPDIIAVGPDGEYLTIVEVKLREIGKSGIEQLKQIMVSLGCSVGMLVSGDRIILLRDSFEKSNGESINVVAEAKLPDSLLPPADEQWKGEHHLEFESRVQKWLEQLKLPASTKNLPNDLKELLSEPIINLLRLGEIRAAGPRWSKAAK